LEIPVNEHRLSNYQLLDQIQGPQNRTTAREIATTKPKLLSITDAREGFVGVVEGVVADVVEADDTEEFTANS